MFVIKETTIYRRTAIDLFSGAGGLTVGLKKAGFKVLLAVDNDATACATYEINHPKIDLIDADITKVDPKKVILDVGLKKGGLDLLAGCPPCQGFSTLRTRNKNTSMEDHRNDLVFEFVKWVRVFLPKTIMMENVPALAKDARMIKVTNSLKRLGYHLDDSSVTVVDAADYGVPQRRKRMLLLVSRMGSIKHPRKSKSRKTVKDAIGNMVQPRLSNDYLHKDRSQRSEKVKNIIRQIPKNGGSRQDLPKNMWLECHKRYPDGFKDVYGRMAWNEVSPTITSGCTNPSKGRFLHPSQNRTITLREAAILQTFPKRYKFCDSRGRDRIALMIGNALPPELIRRHATAILAHIRNTEFTS